MPKPFQLDIVLPETPMPPRTVTAIDVPAVNGRLTVMAHHQPLIAALCSGPMTITDEQGKKETWNISTGALQVARHVATLLVRQATRQHQDASHEDTRT